MPDDLGGIDELLSALIGINVVLTQTHLNTAIKRQERGLHTTYDMPFPSKSNAKVEHLPTGFYCSYPESTGLASWVEMIVCGD